MPHLKPFNIEFIDGTTSSILMARIFVKIRSSNPVASFPVKGPSNYFKKSLVFTLKVVM